MKKREELTIYDLGLEKRIINCLIGLGINYAIELENFTLKYLSMARNLGNKSLCKLINVLSAHNIFIKDDINDPYFIIGKTGDLIRTLETEIALLKIHLEETSSKTLSLKNHLNSIYKHVEDSLKVLNKKSKTDSTIEEQ